MTNMSEKELTEVEREMSRRFTDHKAFKDIQGFMKTQSELNAKIEKALFGEGEETGLVKDVKDMKAFFNSVDGFKRVSVILLKGIILIGGAIGGLYALIELIKKIGK